MSPRLRFDALDRLRWSGVEYVYVRPTVGGHVVRQHHGSLEEALTDDEMTRIVGLPDWRHDPAFYGEAKVRARQRSGVDLFSDMPAKERPKVLWKWQFVVELIDELKGGLATLSDESMTNTIARIDARIPPERKQTGRSAGGKKARGKKARAGTVREVRDPPVPKTLRSWRKLYLEGGKVPGALRDKHRNSGNRLPKLDARVYALINEAIVQSLTEKRPSYAGTHSILKGLVKQANEDRQPGTPELPCPSVKTVTASARARPDFERIANRQGLDLAKRRNLPVKGSYAALRPGDRVEIDEWTINLQLILTRAGVWAALDKKTRRELTGRWLVCIAIDVASRCILGMKIAPYASADLTRAVLRMMVSDKTSLSAAAGAKTPWDMRTNALEVAKDSGPGLFASAARAAIVDMTGQDEIPPVGDPHHRPYVERIAGTLGLAFVEHFTGRTFSGPHERGDYDSQLRASMTPEAVASALTVYVVDVYHNTKHKGLRGETPRAAWLRLQDEWGVRPTPGPDRMRAIFGTELERRANSTGVTVLGLPYWDEELGRRFVARHVTDVTVKLDEEDVGWISVKIGDEWRAVPCVLDGFEGVSAPEWLATMEDLRRRFARQDEMTREVVLDALAAIRGMARDAERSAGIHVAPLGRDVIARAEAEILSGYVVPRNDHARTVPVETRVGALGRAIPAALPDRGTIHRAGEPDPPPPEPAEDPDDFGIEED